VEDDVALQFFTRFRLVCIEKPYFAVDTAFGRARASTHSVAGALVVLVTGRFDEFSARVLRLPIAKMPLEACAPAASKKSAANADTANLTLIDPPQIVFGNV
jgi:hypothetical protein